MAAVPQFTVRMAIASCGVDDIIMWQGRTRAERIAEELFDDVYSACMDKALTATNSDSVELFVFSLYLFEIIFIAPLLMVRSPPE